MSSIVTLLSAFLVVFASFEHAFGQSPFSGFNPAALSERPAGVFVDGTFFTGSDGVPLKAIYLDRWDGPFHPAETNQSDLYWKTGAGATYGGWRLAWFYRGEAFIKTNRDTIELLRMANLKNIDSTDAFDIDMSISGFSATGIELSTGFGLHSLLKGLDAGLTARYLRGLQIQEGTLTGAAMTTSPVSYDFDLFLDYVYDKNLVYDRPDAVRGNGNGLSFDLGFRYVYSPALKAELLFRDILGAIYWKDVPYTTARAASDVISFDEDGFQQYSPTISGFEGHKDFKQKIQLKTDLSVSYTSGPFTLRPVVNFIGDRSLKWIFLGYQAGSNTTFSAGYNLDYNSLSLGASHGMFNIQAFTSNLNIEDANALGLTLSLVHEF